MEGFEGLWFDCETGDQGVTSVEQVKMLHKKLTVVTSNTSVHKTFIQTALCPSMASLAD